MKPLSILGRIVHSRVKVIHESNDFLSWLMSINRWLLWTSSNSRITLASEVHLFS